MNCTEACNLADDYVFGLLEPAVQDEFEQHLKSCEACAKAAEEARSGRKLFDAWRVSPPAGAADKLLARVRSGDFRRQPAYGRLLVRILATAAVILAAVVLPRLFLFEKPVVLSYAPQMTVVEGVFRDSVRQELNIPENFAESAYLIVRLKSTDGKSPVKAAICLNDSIKGSILTGAASSEEIYMLGRERGLREGGNFLSVKNLGSGPLEFEVTLVTGNSR